MRTLSKFQMRYILACLDEALASVPASNAEWMNPGWSIRAARKLLLDAAIADVAVEQVAAEQQETA